MAWPLPRRWRGAPGCRRGFSTPGSRCRARWRAAATANRRARAPSRAATSAHPRGGCRRGRRVCRLCPGRLRLSSPPARRARSRPRPGGNASRAGRCCVRAAAARRPRHRPAGRSTPRAPRRAPRRPGETGRAVPSNRPASTPWRDRRARLRRWCRTNRRGRAGPCACRRAASARRCRAIRRAMPPRAG